LSIDSLNLSSATFGSLSVYLPDGVYSYEFGPASYAFVASVSYGSVTVSGAPLSFDAAFAPRYAVLQGTVTPSNSNAVVTVNGAPIAVSDGAFHELLQAGSYTVDVT